ncbi:MAG: hypothetical protein KAG28_01170 [Cocleimonas sp.]|nr:hypothetical protein [Cocleimonas sp.]
MSKSTPPSNSTLIKEKDRLLATFERMIPLVDSISDSVRFAVLMGVALTLWIFVFLFALKGYELITAMIIAVITLIPALILSRFWWALEELKNLPDILSEALDDAKDEVQATVKNLKANKTQKMGLFGSMKSLFNLRSILSEADDLLGSYISISALVNPFWLILGVLSLLGVLILILIGGILALFTLF